MRTDWAEVCERLRTRAKWPDGADDVQETLLRLCRRLGVVAAPSAALRLGYHILHRCRIDRLRRRSPELLGHAIAEVCAENETARQPPRSRSAAELEGHLTAAACRLLEAICSGVRANKALARILDTSPSAIRRRRLRLQQGIRVILEAADALDPLGSVQEREENHEVP